MDNKKYIQTEALELIPDAVVIYRRDKIVFANNATAVLAGVSSAQELIGRPIENFISGANREKVQDKIRNLLRKRHSHFKWELAKPNGEMVLCELSASIIKYGDKRSVLVIIRNVSERYSMEEELALQRGYFRQLFENSPSGIIMVDNDDRIILSNIGFYSLFGYNRDEAQGQLINDLIVPGYLKEEADSISKIAGSGKAVERETTRMRKDGSLVDVAITGYPIFIDGVQVGIYGIYRDITKRKQAEKDLHESEERYRKLIKHLPEAVFVHLNGNIILANEAAAKLLGVPDPEAIIGRDFLDIIHPDYIEVAKIRLKMVSENRRDIPLRRQKIVRFDGVLVDVEMSATWLNHKGGNAVLSIVRDITERKKTEETINKLAYYDILTGLPNRVLFGNRFNIEIAHARRNEQMLAVLFLDLDRFKNINDSLGHRIGDKLLRKVAQRIKGTLRRNDTISRMGGDEFVILVPGIRKKEDIEVIAAKIMGALQRPFSVNNNQLYITTSIGISVYPEDGENGDILLRRADAAMYSAKELGGNCSCVFTDSIADRIKDRIFILHELKDALEKKQLMLQYQPRYSVKTGSISGAEVLIRWEHPQKGFIPTEKFMPIAEETNAIIHIGIWALETVCAVNRKWQLAGYPGLKMAINVSARQLKSVDFITTVKRVLKETGLTPQGLEFEITEGVIESNTSLFLETIEQLKKSGIGISLEGFGGKCPCIKYLSQGNVDLLKIDRTSFPRLEANTSDRIIINSLICMAHRLGVEVVVENIEEKEQLDAFKDMKCDYVQGSLLSKPLSAQDFEELLKLNTG